MDPILSFISVCAFGSLGVPVAIFRGEPKFSHLVGATGLAFVLMAVKIGLLIHAAG